MINNSLFACDHSGRCGSQKGALPLVAHGDDEGWGRVQAGARQRGGAHGDTVERVERVRRVPLNRVPVEKQLRQGLQTCQCLATPSPLPPPSIHLGITKSQ